MSPAGTAAGSAATDAVPSSLVLAGAGKMGGALLQAWLSRGLPHGTIAVVEPRPSEALAEALRVHRVSLNPDSSSQRPTDILVLAIKPQTLSEAASALAPFTGPETLLLSVVAGKTIDDLRRAFPRVRSVVRAMPNTPAAIRRGITGVACNEAVTTRQRASVQALLEAVGTVEWLTNEGLIDAVTAVSGSGPAYVFLLAECLAKAGEAAGLDADAAARLARATVEGAGALMDASPSVPPAVLRQNVTSPGGTTAAALDVLMRGDGLQRLMHEAVAAAEARARDLAG